VIGGCASNSASSPWRSLGDLWDWAVPPSNHRYLNERLPHSKLDLVDVGHFTWEDAADQDAEIITGW
jgi:pimeloyl-ACP methyl ester carboxylesterase